MKYFKRYYGHQHKLLLRFHNTLTTSYIRYIGAVEFIFENLLSVKCHKAHTHIYPSKSLLAFIPVPYNIIYHPYSDKCINRQGVYVNFCYCKNKLKIFLYSLDNCKMSYKKKILWKYFIWSNQKNKKKKKLQKFAPDWKVGLFKTPSLLKSKKSSHNWNLKVPINARRLK